MVDGICAYKSFAYKCALYMVNHVEPYASSIGPSNIESEESCVAVPCREELKIHRTITSQLWVGSPAWRVRVLTRLG